METKNFKEQGEQALLSGVQSIKSKIEKGIAPDVIASDIYQSVYRAMKPRLKPSGLRPYTVSS